MHKKKEDARWPQDEANMTLGWPQIHGKLIIIIGHCSMMMRWSLNLIMINDLKKSYSSREKIMFVEKHIGPVHAIKTKKSLPRMQP